MSTNNIFDSKLLTKQEVINLIGFSYGTIWLWMRQGRFPRSLVVPGSDRVRWHEREIREWLDNLPRQRLKGDPPDGVTDGVRSSSGPPDA